MKKEKVISSSLRGDLNRNKYKLKILKKQNSSLLKNKYNSELKLKKFKFDFKKIKKLNSKLIDNRDYIKNIINEQRGFLNNFLNEKFKKLFNFFKKKKDLFRRKKRSSGYSRYGVANKSFLKKNFSFSLKKKMHFLIKLITRFTSKPLLKNFNRDFSNENSHHYNHRG